MRLRSPGRTNRPVWPGCATGQRTARPSAVTQRSKAAPAPQRRRRPHRPCQSHENGNMDGLPPPPTVMLCLTSAETLTGLSRATCCSGMIEDGGAATSDVGAGARCERRAKFGHSTLGLYTTETCRVRASPAHGDGSKAAPLSTSPVLPAATGRAERNRCNSLPFSILTSVRTCCTVQVLCVVCVRVWVLRLSPGLTA